MAATTASPPHHATRAGPLRIAPLPMSSSTTASVLKKTTFARASDRRRENSERGRYPAAAPRRPRPPSASEARPGPPRATINAPSESNPHGARRLDHLEDLDALIGARACARPPIPRTPPRARAAARSPLRADRAAGRRRISRPDDGHEVGREGRRPAQPRPPARVAQPRRARAERHQTRGKRQRTPRRHHECRPPPRSIPMTATPARLCRRRCHATPSARPVINSSIAALVAGERSLKCADASQMSGRLMTTAARPWKSPLSGRVTAGAIGGAEPGGGVRETQHDAAAPGKPAGFGERAQKVRASEHDERPADERHESWRRRDGPAHTAMALDRRATPRRSRRRARSSSAARGDGRSSSASSASCVDRTSASA